MIRKTRSTQAPSSLIGQRVELHPATSEWMQDDRYGLVVSTRWTLANPGVVSAVVVKLDRSGRVRCFHPDNVTVLA